MDKANFFDKVYDVVAQIPFGMVTTYGHIAEHLGTKGSARMVGWALNGAGVRHDLPCHRVVNRFGALSGKIHFGDFNTMEDLLRSEGIAFTDEGCVDLDKHLWIPS